MCVCVSVMAGPRKIGIIFWLGLIHVQVVINYFNSEYWPF